MGSTVFFQGAAEQAVLGNTFTVAGVPTDPATVTLTVTDPAFTVTTYTYPATITKTGTGVYSVNQPCTLEGMWSYTWTGTGTASDVTSGTFTVSPNYLSRFYCSVAELKSRIGLASTDTSDDDQLLLAVQAATRAIDQFTGRYFWSGTDTRVYSTFDIESCRIDDLVSITSLSTDSTGLGTYDQVWAAGDYRLEPANAPASNPEPEPYTAIRALAGGGGRFWFPWVYPLSNPDRVKVTGVFGWPAVPYLVKQAALQAAEDAYKLKDAPFGVMGSADGLGLIRVSANPKLAGMLYSYVRGRKVGV